ncbi:hypothetical protein GCM10011507_10430 [Edaphobacter acidisoli]|uniref:Ice-binding protein C-terminal domain-containing protein n=1 Tax=Edaphobacter acidisoli TaxID=2040573 RepID=A0A916W218_9BACT|nr:PEP-CTERM sorting domain-containing protein [Edaphobacter acidisoli]GGA60804.1 hypothetical protein GCM10011507_10430 [Edaphobacter acidisoli]
MRIKVIGSMVSALLCGSFAFATPIAYTFTNASNFTLNGTSYTGPYLGIPPSAPQLTFTLNADTDNVFSSGSFNGSTPGTGYILNKIGTTTVSYGGTTLATLTDPTAFVISTFFGGTVSLVDEVNGDMLISDPLGIGYNGITNFPGTNLLTGGYPFSPIDTSAGQLVITSSAYQGQFKAAVAPAVPEPSTIVLLGSGALGFAGLLRRWFIASQP